MVERRIFIVYLKIALTTNTRFQPKRRKFILTIDGNRQFKEVSELLQNGKRVTMENRPIRYSEDYNDPNVKSWSSTNVKHTAIEYIYTNPQFNRMFAHLEDGRDVDYNLSLMDIFWNKFIEYVPSKPAKKKITIDEIEKQLGYEIEIADK